MVSGGTDLDVLAGLDFSNSMRDAKKGLIVKPILHNYLYDAEFPNFTIKFNKGNGNRAPDDWFHPSTHPLWTPRALYSYLAHPQLMIPEKKPYMGTLSVTMGTAMHGFVDMCLKEANWLAIPKDDCPVCGDRKKSKCTEWGVLDLEVRERGHGDGVSLDGDWYEFKTSNELSTKIRRAEDLDLEYFKANWPDYYAQVQSYMRMSGHRRAIVLFFILGYPWPMKEFHVPFDRQYSTEIRDKYLRVREAVAATTPPRGCCGSKTCPSFGACELMR